MVEAPITCSDPLRVLVVAAHADDEVLGCGGIIARHADAEDQVRVLIVAEGATSRQQQRDRRQATEALSSLAQAAQKAGAMGAEGVELLDLPDNRLDSLDRLDMIKIIEERIALHPPQVVYVLGCSALRWPAAPRGSHPPAQHQRSSPAGLSTSPTSDPEHARP